MSIRKHQSFRPHVIASAVAAIFCGISGSAMGQAITVTGGIEEVTGAGNETKYLLQSGGVVNVRDTSLGADFSGLSARLSGDALLNVGSGANLLGGIELAGSSTLNLGVQATQRAVVKSSVSLTADNFVALDNVFIDGGDGLGALRVQGASTATSTAKTVIHASGDGNHGVIVGDTSSMHMTGSQVSSDLGAGILTQRNAKLEMQGVTSIGARAGLLVSEASQVSVTGGALTSTGNPPERFRFGDVYGAGVAMTGHNFGTAGQHYDPPSLTLSNVTVTGQGARSAGLVSLAHNSDVNVLAQNSTISGGRDGIVFLIDDRSVGKVAPGLTSISLVDTSVRGGTGAGMRVGSEAMVAMVMDGKKSTLTGGNGVALQTDAGSQTDMIVRNGASVLGNALNAGGKTNIMLASGGSWTGALRDVSNLTVAGGTMTLTGDSSVTSILSMSQNGRVDLNGQIGGFHTLTVDKLSGSGIFGFGTYIASPGAPVGDLLVVKGEAKGDYKVAVADSGGEPSGQPLTIVKTGGGDAKFGLQGDAPVAVGNYYYGLAKNGNNWELKSTGQTTPYTNSVANIVGVAPTIWYGQLLTVRERFGELSFKQDQGGVWVRPYGSQYNVNSAAGPRYKQTQSGVAAGVDKAFAFLDGKTYVGALFNYSNSSLDDRAGAKGTVDAYSIGAYATWLGNNGYYLHGLVTANRYISKARASTANGGSAEGSFSTNGVGVAMEGGRRFDTESKWFVQPYAQISALHMQGSRFGLSNGMNAKGDGVDSLQAAIGTQVGRAFHSANGDVVEPYVRVAVVHEFVKSNDISINDHSFNANLSGSRFELGVGSSLQIGKHLSAHLDYAYAHGSKMTQPYLVNAGLRYQW